MGIFTLIAVAFLTAPAAPEPLPTPPACEAQTKLDKKNRSLQKALEKRLVEAGYGRQLKRQQVTVALVDLSEAGQTYYAGVNDDEMLYAASLPKIAILLANAQAAADNKQVWTAEHDQRMFAMITESSNEDAAWGYNQVGVAEIESVVRDPRYCLYDDKNGGLWVGMAYGKSDETKRDPLKNLSHAATAQQAARFFAMLNNRELVSKEWSEHMLQLMGPPKHHHKFVAGLKDRPGVTFIARKSGTWRNWHSDGALIQHDDQRYAAVVLTETRNGEQVVQHIIGMLDDLVMEGKYRKGSNKRS